VILGIWFSLKPALQKSTFFDYIVEINNRTSYLHKELCKNFDVPSINASVILFSFSNFSKLGVS
jgi:hypothetical protein